MSSLEPTPSASSMTGRVLNAVSRMVSSIARAVDVSSFKYNERAVKYNEPRVTYEFKTFRGEMDPSTPPTPSMKGR